MPPRHQAADARQAERADGVPIPPTKCGHRVAAIVLLAVLLRALLALQAAVLTAAIGLIKQNEPRVWSAAAAPPLLVLGSSPCRLRRGMPQAERARRRGCWTAVGTAAEAEQKDAVARLVHPYEGVVAIRDILRHPEPGGAADKIIEAAQSPVFALQRRAKAGIVESGLHSRKLPDRPDRTGKRWSRHAPAIRSAWPSRRKKSRYCASTPPILCRAAKYKEMYAALDQGPERLLGRAGQAHRLDQAFHQGQEHLLRPAQRLDQMVRGRHAQRRLQLHRPASGQARRPDRHHLGRRRSQGRQEDHL